MLKRKGRFTAGKRRVELNDGSGWMGVGVEAGGEQGGELFGVQSTRVVGKAQRIDLGGEGVASVFVDAGVAEIGSEAQGVQEIGEGVG